MADSGSTWAICKELLVVPVPSGLLMLTNRVVETADPVVVAAAMSQREWHDGVPVFLVGDLQMSMPVQRYLSGLTGPERERLVVVPQPWPGMGRTYDAVPAVDRVEELEQLADFYEVPVHAPPGPTMSPRVVPVDGDGLETSDSVVSAVRVLPRAQAAMRESVRTALEIAAGGQEPSWERLEEYVNRVAEIHAELRGPWRAIGSPVGNASPPTAAYALGSYVVRYGVPAGVDRAAWDRVVRSAMPLTVADLSAVLGGTPAAVDAEVLIAGLLAAPGSAALVRFKPVDSGPEQLLWLMSDGGRDPALWWVEPHSDGTSISAAVLDPAANDWRTAVLRDPATRVLLVDPAGRVVTVDVLAAGGIVPVDVLAASGIVPVDVPAPGGIVPVDVPAPGGIVPVVPIGGGSGDPSSSSADAEVPPSPLTDLGRSRHGYLSIGSIGELSEGTPGAVRQLAVDAWARFSSGTGPAAQANTITQETDPTEPEAHSYPPGRPTEEPPNQPFSAIRAAVDELLTEDRLLTDMPSLMTKQGGVYIVGTGDDAIRMTVKVQLNRRDEPGLMPAMPDPEATQGEIRTYHRTSVTVQHSHGNFRDAPWSKRFNIGLGPFAENHWLRQIPLTAIAQPTYNQWKRKGSAVIGAGHGVIIRNREPNYGYFYTAQWSVEVGPVVPPAPARAPNNADSLQPVDEAVVAPPTWLGSLKAYFPEHIAIPHPQPAFDGEATGLRLDRTPMVLDTLHDPSSIALELLARFPDLDLDSQKHILHVFASHDNMISGWLRLRRGGLVSDPLYARDGTPLGVLRLRVTLPSQHPEAISRSTNTKLEFYDQGTVAESGSSGIRNALVGGIQASFNISNEPLSADGSTSFGPVFAARYGRTSEHRANSGGSSSIGRGFKSGGDASRNNAPFGSLVADVDLEWTAELLTGNGQAGDQHQWSGGVNHRTGARVSYLGYTLRPPDPTRPVYPPAGVADGDALGFVTLEEFETDAELDNVVRDQLIERGYLASDAGSPRQTHNLRSFLDVVDPSYRETLADDLLADGIWVPFEKELSGGGIERIMVRWTATIAPQTQLTYRGYTPDLGLTMSGDTSQALDGSHSTSRIMDFRGEFDVNFPVQRSHVSTVPVALSPYQYVNERVETKSGGSSVGRSVILESEGGERLHKFTYQRLQLRAEIYEMGHKQPTWRFARVDGQDYQDAEMDVWIADYRVRETPAARPAPAPEPELVTDPPGREVTREDREALARPAGQVVKNMAGLTSVRGSKALNTIFDNLLTERYGEPLGWVLNGLMGPRPTDQTTVSAQLRRVFVSPLRLFGSLQQILYGAYSTEPYQWGALSGPEYRMELRAYVSGLPTLVPPREREASYYIEDGSPLNRTSTAAAETDITRQVTGQAGPTLKLPYDTALNISGSGRYGRVDNKNSASSRVGTDYRIHTYTGRQFNVTLPLTFIATLHGAARNPLTSVLSLAGMGSTVSQRALDVPDGIEAHLSILELAALMRTMRELHPNLPDDQLIQGLDHERNQNLLADLRHLNELYQADQEALHAHEEPRMAPDRAAYLPRRIAARWGLGDAPIGDVLLDPQRSARVLFESGLTRVEELVPGATRLGSNTYAPGLHTNLADLTAPLAVRGALPRYFAYGNTDRVVELNQFTVYTTQRGQALAITLRLLAKPAEGFTTAGDLSKIFGRRHSELDMEIHSFARQSQTHGHTTGSTTAQTVTVAGTTPNASAARLRDFSPSLYGSHVRDASRFADETYQHSDRYVSKSVDGSAQAEFPIELAIDATVEKVDVPGPAQAIPNLIGALIGSRHNPNLDWVSARAVLEFMADDGSAHPVTAQPPAGYHAPTEFDTNPMQDGDASPVEEGPQGAEHALARFRPADMRNWRPYSGAPRQHKLSWFSGDQVLADLATVALPDNARFEAGRREIERFVDGLAGPGNSYRLLSQAGIRHTVTSHDWGRAMVYEGTLEIQVINASPWRDPAETLDTGKGDIPTVVGEHTRSVSELFLIKAASSSASFNADRLLGLNGQQSSDVGSRTIDSSHGSLRYLTVALTGGENSGVGATTFGSTRRALRLVQSADSRNALKQRDLLLVVRGTTRTRPLGQLTWGVPRVSQRWLAATMETRVHESFLPAERTARVDTGLHLPSPADPAAGPASLAHPGYDRWVLIHGQGVATPTGTLASGRTAAEIDEALDSQGFPVDANLILAIDQASFRDDRSLAAELARLRPRANILATERPNILGHDHPTPWQLYHGVEGRISLSPDLDLSVQRLDERVAPASPGPTSTAAAGTSAVPKPPAAKGNTPPAAGTSAMPKPPVAERNTPAHQPTAFTAPQNTRYEGHVLVVDSGQSWQRAAVTPEQIVQAAQHADRPVIAINVSGGLAADGPELTALSTALQRYEWFGVRPVVVATAETKAFRDVRDRYRPVTIQPRPVGLEQTWQLADPTGTVLREEADLTAQLFDEAGRWPVTPDGHQLPPVLAGLLGQNTWPDGERYLRQNVSELMEPAVAVALGKLHQREPDDSRVDAYEVILGLVRKAGGITDASEPRFRPAEPIRIDDLVQEFSFRDPLPETFAFDYLVPRPDRDSRKPWNDQLLRLMYLNKLSAADAVALARGVHEVAARSFAPTGGSGSSARPAEMVDRGPANATVFAAIGDVLGIDHTTAERLAQTTDPVAESGVLKAAVEQIHGCRLDPLDRLFWVGRIEQLVEWLAPANVPAPDAYESRIAGLLRILNATLSAC